MTRGLDRKDPFLSNRAAFSSTIPILADWIIEKSSRNSSDKSTALAATPVNDSRDDKGTVMRDEDSALEIVLKFGNMFSTLSWEGYSCVSEYSM